MTIEEAPDSIPVRLDSRTWIYIGLTLIGAAVAIVVFLWEMDQRWSTKFEELRRQIPPKEVIWRFEALERRVQRLENRHDNDKP